MGLKIRFRLSLLLALVLPCLGAEALAQAETEPKVLTLKDYAQWNRITSVQISADGRWVSFAYEPNEGDGTLRVKQLDGETEYTAQNGSAPGFSDDSNWAAYLTGPTEEETEKLQKEDKHVFRTLHLVNLATGEKKEFERISSFRFANGSQHLAIVADPGDRDMEHSGRDLLVRDLGEGTMLHLGNVSEFAFDEVGSRLAYLVDAAGQAGNGVYMMDLPTSRMRSLDTGSAQYSHLTWNQDGEAVAALKGVEKEDLEQRENVVLVFFDLDSANGIRRQYDPAADNGFPADMVLSEHRALDWSEDGRRIFVGIKAQSEKIEDGDEPRANVDVWHWRDERIQSVQMVQANADRRATKMSVVHLLGPDGRRLEEPRFVRLGDDRVRTVTVSESPRWAIGRSDTRYRGDMSQAGGRADYARIDLWTGDRAPMLFSLRQAMGSSPDGRWFLYMLDGHVHARDVATGRTTDLSEQAGVDFVNHAADRPSEKPSYGIAGWPSTGDSVLLNHEFDIWQVPLGSTTDNGNASAVNLTRGVGSERKIRFRLVQLDPQEDTFDMSGSLVLSAYGEWTKESGYWGLEPGQAPRPALFEAAMIGGLRRAEKWDRLLYTRQTFVDFPDYWVADTGMQNARKITDANPQQSEYRWSPGRVLIDYVDGRGNELQATLTLPAGYEEGVRYPMLVYFYEKMSQRHHQYSMPTYDDRPHMSTYASDGYLVLMPDIVYSDGKPGSSSLDDVTAAVNKVISLGYTDPAHIGLQGHSWGGYESSYVVTQTDMFACVVTGAPLTNLVSMHNILYKRSGNPNAPLIEWGQGRMAANPWSDLKSYQEQSPVHNAEGITTPFMILHGTEDGAVDWNQGLEFYIAARRLGKEVILLSYPGEPHHLGKVENQKDFQIRMKSYFDHYLKGRPAPAWMVEGVPFLDKGRAKPDGKSGG